MPEVICDWREVTLEQVGPDRVRASGARGRAPTSTYKATATHVDGFRAMTTAMFAGVEAAGRARRAGEALIARAARLISARGFAGFAETSIEVIGAGDTYGTETRPDTAVEAVLKVGVRHPEREALEIFAGEFAPMALVAQGMTGVFAGRPRVAPAIRVLHLLVDKAAVQVRLRIGEEVVPLKLAPGDREAVTATQALDEPRAGAEPAVGTITIPLRRLAYGRSGDKGNLVNIGLIARRPEFTAILRDQVTAARVASFFGHYLANGGVRRWAVPGVSAINIVLPDVLGGSGGTSTLRYDPQGKSYAAMLLTLPVTVPSEWDRNGLLAGMDGPR
jgi:hypothetical protein